MRVITVLNGCTEFKRFVFEGSRLDGHGRLVVGVRPRKNSKAACSCFGALSPTYDTAAEPRLFEPGVEELLNIQQAGAEAKR